MSPFFGITPKCPYDNCGSQNFRVVRWRLFEDEDGMASFIVCDKCHKIIGAQEFFDEKKFKEFEDRLQEIEKKVNESE